MWSRKKVKWQNCCGLCCGSAPKKEKHWRCESKQESGRVEEELRRRLRRETRTSSARDVGQRQKGVELRSHRCMCRGVKWEQALAAAAGNPAAGRSKAVKTHPGETKREGGEKGHTAGVASQWGENSHDGRVRQEEGLRGRLKEVEGKDNYLNI